VGIAGHLTTPDPAVNCFVPLVRLCPGAHPGGTGNEVPDRAPARCGRGVWGRTLGCTPNHPEEGDMQSYHHLMASELADLHRRDLIADADRHRRVRHDRSRRHLRRR
jgi:hypothetical protein